MKTIGEVGITYFDTPPENCLLLPVTITEAEYPDLFAVGMEEISFGNTLFVQSGNNIQIRDVRFPVARVQGDADFDTLGHQGGARTVALTVGQLPQHTHTQNAHTHTQTAHTHTQTAHNHTQSPHTHLQIGHDHSVPVGHVPGQVWALVHTGWATRTDAGRITATTATNYAATATNQNATATNQNTTAVNQNFTAVNQFTGGSGTAQSASNGTAHSNLPPYTVVNMWICYQE